ncbi:MAG: universal stress protein [Pseudomonadota bacterium]
MYKNILVPIALGHEEPGNGAIAVARSLLDPDGGVTLLHVLESMPGFVAAQIPKEVVAESRDLAMKELESIASASGLEAKVEMIMGHPGRSIVDYAQEHGTDCIVVASHRPGLQDYFIGSTAAFVVRHAGCPVHVTR